MKQPNFMCIGAPKSGTTTLYDILKQHPDVFLTSFKEPHFFDVDNNYKEGYEWYINEYYGNINKQKAIGEFTPSYFIVPKVSERIYENIGKNIKFILILRNPIDRAYSQYLHNKRDLLEKLTFNEALEQEHERLKIATWNRNDIFSIRHSYISGGLYYKNLSEFLKKFHISQFKIFIFEDEFKNNRASMLMDIYKFLDIEPKKINVEIKSNVTSETRFSIIKRILNNNSKIKSFTKHIIKSKKTRGKIRNFLQKISNKKTKKQDMDIQTKLELIDKYFIEDIKKLEKLINRDLSNWYNYAD